MTLPIPALAHDLLAGAFAGGARAAGASRCIGAEVEFIPVESHSGRRCPIESEGMISTLPFLRRFGNRQGWQEGCTSKGTPCFTLPGGGSITFEPGGQLEYSSPPCSSALALLSLLRSVVLPLRAAAAAEGIDLLASGIDPLNSIEDAPLVIHAKRYQRMAEYLSTRGPAGARMMRQTAAFQVSLDFGDEPWLRWRVLNAAAPYTMAIFANSPIYQGHRTGHQSTRAAVWREVDPARTGIVYDGERPVDAYLDFALTAPAILLPTLDGEHRPFREWTTRAAPTMEEWHDHLSTLFPEVRPRSNLELRSLDALPPHWYAAPIALVSGLLYDSESLRAADDLLGAPDPALLHESAGSGLHNPELARTAADLFQIALRGCSRLGATYFHPIDLEQATAFFDGYTRRGRAPADEIIEKAIAA
jgi:glutamate--cysteine ligase